VSLTVAWTVTNEQELPSPSPTPTHHTRSFGDSALYKLMFTLHITSNGVNKL